MALERVESRLSAGGEPFCSPHGGRHLTWLGFHAGQSLAPTELSLGRSEGSSQSHSPQEKPTRQGSPLDLSGTFLVGVLADLVCQLDLDTKPERKEPQLGKCPHEIQL